MTTFIGSKNYLGKFKSLYKNDEIKKANQNQNILLIVKNFSWIQNKTHLGSGIYLDLFSKLKFVKMHLKCHQKQIIDK